MMTNWLPDLSTTAGPLYIRIADAAERDIKHGRLGEGAKLPPQRDIAYDLGVTIGTISRAYNLLRERGLVSGEVGRGTYVLNGRHDKQRLAGDPILSRYGGTRPLMAPAGKLRFDTTAAVDVGQAAIVGRLIEEITRQHPGEITGYTRAVAADWQDAGRQWLANENWAPDANSITPHLGVHAAVTAIITAVTAAGDRIVCEHVTYSQVARSATLIGRQVCLVDSDVEGMLPEDFERLCAREHPKLAFIISSGQNPTTSTLPEERRRQIAEIARRHNVWLVEDYIYGTLIQDGIPLLAEIAPDRTFLVSGLSKSVAAGVRGAWVAAPEHFTQRLRVTQKMISGGLPFILAELAGRLVLSGAAADIRDRVVNELTIREKLVREIFSGYSFRSHERLPFFWLKLPEPWLSGTFKQAAFNEGVLIDDEDEFKAGRSQRVYHHVRVGFSEGADREEVFAGLQTLRRLLDAGPAAYDTYS